MAEGWIEQRRFLVRVVATAVYLMVLPTLSEESRQSYTLEAVLSAFPRYE